MKTQYAAFCLGLLLGSVPTNVRAADTDADKDITPVTQCEGLPPSVSISVMTSSDTTKVCREMARALEGIRRKGHHKL
jgi:hypothetical protein